MDREDRSPDAPHPADQSSAGALEASLTRDDFGEATLDVGPLSAATDDMYLVFVSREALFAVQAPRVESVIPWREPVPLPGSGRLVRGVIQDRGRVIAVLRHPDGTVKEGSGDATRVLICPTPLGLVGLPASRTFAVAVLPRAGGTEASVIDTELGPATHVEPDALAARIAGAP